MDIFELLQSLTLVDVRTIESVASLALDPSPGTGLSTFSGAEPTGEVTIKLNPVSWGKRMETWFRLEVVGNGFNLAVGVAVLYERDTDEFIDASVQREFLEKIGIMTAYPYLRAEVQSLATDLRIGTLTLGILRQGQFTVAQDGVTGPADATSS